LSLIFINLLACAKSFLKRNQIGCVETAIDRRMKVPPAVMASEQFLPSCQHDGERHVSMLPHRRTPPQRDRSISGTPLSRVARAADIADRARFILENDQYSGRILEIDDGSKEMITLLAGSPQTRQLPREGMAMFDNQEPWPQVHAVKPL